MVRDADTQIGGCRFAHQMPISGKPEIGVGLLPMRSASSHDAGFTGHVAKPGFAKYVKP